MGTHAGDDDESRHKVLISPLIAHDAPSDAERRHTKTGTAANVQSTESMGDAGDISVLEILAVEHCRPRSAVVRQDYGMGTRSLADARCPRSSKPGS